jgi:oligopeptide transport system permease protein
MTDAASEIKVVKGRSLWGDAWLRLRANKAAVGSAVYLVVVVLACLIGPTFTGHDFRTIYQSYVRVPPSLSPYPQGESIEAGIREALKRAGVDVASWEEQDGRIFVTVTGDKPVDERVTRYLDRSDSFEGTRLEEKSVDGLTLTMSTLADRKHFYFGTDPSGRDLLTRTLIAGRISLSIGLLAGFVALVIGVLYGATAGLVGGKTDEIMMRIVDILYALPFTFFVIMLVVFFGRNFVLMFVAVGAVLWLDMARIVRGQTLSIKRQEYVQAAEALGVGSSGILWRHVIPNALGPIVVYVTLLVPQVIILESFLSFLGLGVQEPMSSWGVQISQGARNIEGATWLLLFPSLFLTSTLFALNFIGDGLRDALDPKDR